MPEPGENETVYNVTMKQLDGLFAPQVNAAYERHLFCAMKQLSDETVHQFITNSGRK